MVSQTATIGRSMARSGYFSELESPEAPRPLFRISRRLLLDLALHLNTRASEAHHELERLSPGVADAVETFRRRHHAERTRADRTRLVADAHLAFTLQNEEAFLDIAIADLLPVHRDHFAGIDLDGSECQLRRSLRRIEVDGETHARCRVSAFLATTVVVIPTLGSSASAAPSPLQSAFSRAAAEFHVPANVLLAVSYTLSRWESSAAPSAAGAFGPMQLGDVASAAFAGAKGDEPARAAQPALVGPTVAAAANATGASARDLKTNAKQNIRGGAAVLAQYAHDTVGSLPADAAKWYGAVAKYSGSTDAAVALGFADSVFATMDSGATHTTSDGQTIVLAATAGT